MIFGFDNHTAFDLNGFTFEQVIDLCAYFTVWEGGYGVIKCEGQPIYQWGPRNFMDEDVIADMYELDVRNKESAEERKNRRLDAEEHY